MDLHKYFLGMETENILLLYKGQVSNELLRSLLKTTEQKLEQMGEKVVIRKKIFNVMVESIQNLIKHVEEHELNANSNNAILAICHSPGYYLVATGNFIPTQDAQDLSNKLDRINGMNRDELREYYQSVLENESLSAKGGAGLGLIDIARKSGEKVNYSLKPINDTLSFFTLTIKVNSHRD
ncbi:MAG: hypothetical protein EBS07_00910 [Sphingobacteriia bacterium]|nr:hypothetical protein [Sphingobacteriia bacterium]